MSTNQSLSPNPFANASVRKANTVVYAASLVAKASNGVLYGISGYNSGAAQFIQVHDAATLPADAAVPMEIIRVIGTGSFSIDYGAYGIPMNVGIVVCNSSTGPAKTIGAADTWFVVRYK